MAKDDSKDDKFQEICTYIVVIIVGFLLASHLNVVVSGSMEPVFYRGDIVAVEKSEFLGINEFNPETDVNVGDIVVYNAKWFNSPVIHRVIEKNNNSNGTYYIIKGDHNPTADPLKVYPKQIVSKVLTIGNHPISIPYIGYITILLRGL